MDAKFAVLLIALSQQPQAVAQQPPAGQLGGAPTPPPRLRPSCRIKTR